MRPLGRIDAFLNALGKEWKRQSPDLRFGQFLIGNGIGEDDIFNMEDYDFMDKYFPKIRKQEYVVWGTRGKDGRQSLTHVPLSELSDSHISNIIRTQSQIPVSFKELLKDEQLFRRKLKINKLLGK